MSARHVGIARSFALIVAAFALGGCPTDPEPDADAGSRRDAGRPVCTSDEACSDDRACNGVEQCDPSDSAANSYGCVRGDAPCGSGQVCSEPSGSCRACDGMEDEDGDGVGALSCGGQDCDDSDPDVRPGMREVCDADDVDEDCDPTTTGAIDADGDRELDAECCNVDVRGDRICGSDCDDDDVARRAGQPELCDEIDNDCDGVVDESAAAVAWYADEDGDGFGAIDAVATLSCAPIAGTALNAGDCDDSNAEVSRVGVESCDGADEDCDGRADEGLATCRADGGPACMDLDGDGHGARVCGGDDCDDHDAMRFPGNREVCDDGHDEDCVLVTIGVRDIDRDSFVDVACANTDVITIRGTDCNDSDPASGPGERETCDGRDNDCDGATDENLAGTFYVDADRDGAGTRFRPAGACDAALARTSITSDDCDDANGSITPGRSETCNGRDDDCDERSDEGVRLQWFYDYDGDGVGYDDGETGYESCAPEGGYVASGNDCDDNDYQAYPGAPERFNEWDDDCDGTIDEAPYLTEWCGDGAINRAEVCDDGRNVGDYGGCMRGCAELGPRCGDNEIDYWGEGYEECDDGNTVDGDGCQADCTVYNP